VVGAAAASQDRQPRQPLADGEVTTGKLDRVARVELLRLVELGMALRRCVRAYAPQSLPRTILVEHGHEVRRVGAVDHVVGDHTAGLVIDLVDRLGKRLAAR